MIKPDPLLRLNIGDVGARWCTVGVGLVHRWCISIAGGVARLWVKCTNLTNKKPSNTSLYRSLSLYRKRVGVVGVGGHVVRCLPVIVIQRGLVHRWCRDGAPCA